MITYIANGYWGCGLNPDFRMIQKTRSSNL